MPRGPDVFKIEKSWKIEIIQNEIDSNNLALSNPDWFAPGEEEFLTEIRDNLVRWSDELEGRTSEKPTADDIDLRIESLDNIVLAFSQILEHEESLTKREREDIKEDIVKLKIWKSELRKKKKNR